jgi:hypothetical protein
MTVAFSFVSESTVPTTRCFFFPTSFRIRKQAEIKGHLRVFFYMMVYFCIRFIKGAFLFTDCYRSNKSLISSQQPAVWVLREALVTCCAACHVIWELVIAR